MKFQLVCNGPTDPEASKSRTADKVSLVLGQSYSSETLFSDEPVILKTNLDMREAQEWIERLANQAGLSCRMEPVADSLEWSLEPVEESRKITLSCPACGHQEELEDQPEVLENHVCEQCGVVTEKYREQERLRIQKQLAEEARLAEQEAQSEEEDQQNEDEQQTPADPVVIEVDDEEEEQETPGDGKPAEEKKKKPALALLLVLVLALAGLGYYFFPTESDPEPEASGTAPAEPATAPGPAPDEPKSAAKTSRKAKSAKKTSRPAHRDRKKAQDKALGRAAAKLALDAKPEEVARITQYIDDKATYVDMVASIAVENANSGHPQQSEKTFRLAKNIADSIEDKEQKYRALYTLAGQYASLGKRKEARRLFAQAKVAADNIDDEIQRIAAQADIASQEWKSQFKSQASKGLETARLWADNIPQTDRRLVALTHVAKAMAAMERKEEAEALFKQILLEARNTPEISRRQRNSIRKLVALQQLSANKARTSIRTVETIDDPEIKGETVVELLDDSKLHKQTETREVNQLLTYASNNSYRIKGMATLAKFRQSSGQTENAQALFDKARTQAEMLADDNERLVLLSFIAKQMMTAERIEQGQALYRNVLEDPALRPDAGVSDPLLQTLAKDLADVGLFEESVSLSERIRDRDTRQRANQYSSRLLGKARILESLQQASEAEASERSGQ